MSVTAVSGTGVMSSTTIGSNLGTVSAGSISGMSVTSNSGSITANGAGNMTGIHVGTNTSSGLIKAVEDSHVAHGARSGVILNSAVGVNLGHVFAGAFSHMKVGTNAKLASIRAAGQGTTTSLSVGTNSGSITAAEDTMSGTAVSGTGVMSSTTIGSNLGTVSAGSISGMSVTSNSGSITANGAGNMTGIHVGTNTSSGLIRAVEDSHVARGARSGVILNSAVGVNLGHVFAGAFSHMKVGTNAKLASIRAAGQGTTTDLSVGTNSGSITAAEDTMSGTAVSGTGVMSSTTIGSNSGTVSAGSISAMSVTSNSGSITANGAGIITNLQVGNNSGSITAKQDRSKGSGALNDITIGQLTMTGTVSAATADNLTITTFEGSIQVTSTLSNLSAGTLASTATLSAGHVNVMSVQSAPSTIEFVESGVTRTMAVTSHNGGALPANHGFYFDGTGPGDPNVTLLFNAGPNANVSFDVSLLTNTVNQPGSGFDLAGIYAVGQAHVHNIVVGGDLLAPTAVSPAALAFFGLPTGTPGGVDLPLDTVAVAVAGNLPAGSIVAKAVPALAAASFAGVPAETATPANALKPLATGTSLTQAKDTFQVFVGQPSPVAQFLVTGTGGSFDTRPMVFADQANGNSPVTVTDTLVLPPRSTSTAVSTVAFHGQGGSLTTAQPVSTAITSDGSLGDLVLSAPQGLTANVTAPSIVGNINVKSGGISGIIETSGDLGRTFTDSHGKITGVTSIQTVGGFTGQIIVGGNLISDVEIGGMTGVISVQGNIGTILTNSIGGVTSIQTGGLTGQIIVGGNLIDVEINAGMTGVISVQGNIGTI